MKHFRRSWIVFVILSLVCLAAVSVIHEVRAASPTQTFWLQTMDSCRQAIPGASFVLTGKGLKVNQGPAPGTKPVSVGLGNCPIQLGNCVSVPTGCLSWNVPIPASGRTVTYKITETSSPAGYVPCTGGSVCTGGPVVITLTLTSSGVITAKAYNVYPDGTSVTWPTTGGPYTGTQTDPVVVHNFGLGIGSCDGDGDADDYLTGSPSVHCDNDKDPHP